MWAPYHVALFSFYRGKDVEFGSIYGLRVTPTLHVFGNDQGFLSLHFWPATALITRSRSSTRGLLLEPSTLDQEKKTKIYFRPQIENRHLPRPGYLNG